MTPKIVIPAGLTFATLALEREPSTRRLLYKPVPLAQLIQANGMDFQDFFASEDMAAWLIAEFYLAHRTAGGEPDPIAEDLLAEVAAARASGIAAP